MDIKKNRSRLLPKNHAAGSKEVRRGGESQKKRDTGNKGIERGGKRGSWNHNHFTGIKKGEPWSAKEKKGKV